MWIKKSTYNEMLDLINQQRKEIEYLKVENITNYHRCRKAEGMLSGLIRFVSANAGSNIDFPNTQKGGFEDSNIFTM